MNDLISRQALYEKTKKLDTLALDRMEKLKERDSNEYRTEWRIWNAVLQERQGFMKDVCDAPSADVPDRNVGEWIHGKHYHCSECGYTVKNIRWNVNVELVDRYCTFCGADMRGERDE